MKIVNILLAGIIGMAALAGCTKEQIDKFSGGAQVYFKTDSMTYSFAVHSDNLMFDTVAIPIYVTGSRAAVEREIHVVVVPDSSTAVADEDFVMVRAVLPAGEFETMLKIRVNRSEKLKQKEYSLALLILPTEELGTDVDPRWLDYKLKINDILTKPARWIYGYAPYFGDYSEVKYRFIIEKLGIWEFPDSGENAIPKAQMLFYQDKMKTELAKWEKANGKSMLDEKGNAIKF